MMSLKSAVRSFAVAALVSGAAVSGAAVFGAQAGDATMPVNVKPMQAFNLELGAKRAIGYFLADDRSCDLTVMLSDISYQEDGIIPTASRVGVAVAAGTSAKVDMVDGQTVAFHCSNMADRMSVSVFQRLALSPSNIQR